MQTIYVFALVALAATAYAQYEIVEDYEGEQYYLLPLSRQRRQTNWGLAGPGLNAGISHKGNIFKNDNHRLDGSAYATKDLLHSKGLRPDTAGGRLDYSHIPSGSGLGVGADHVRRGGTNLNAAGNWNVYKKGNFGVDVRGQYDRTFGGPGGTGRPNYGASIVGHGRF